MKKEELQAIIDDLKDPLQKYWTNEVKLPLPIQLHSMALMDLFIEHRFSKKFGDMRVCYSCRRKDETGKEAIHNCLHCGKPLCLKCSFFASDYVPTGPYCGKCGY